MKYCSTCKKELDESCFGKNKRMADGLSYICKSCKKEFDRKYYLKTKQPYNYDRHLEWRHGIGAAKYRKWKMVEQKEKCAICGKKSKLCFDHNHENGSWRGLLCYNCNSKLGWLELNFDKIMKYMKKYSS